MTFIRGIYQKHCKRVWFFAVLLTAVLWRVVLFSSHPGGLNQDEASVGYDAWALLHYGMDRNGYSMPVHLLAWGSGQNALYAYLSMPFIAAFGLNAFSVRCVNLIFGIVTVAAVFFIMNRYKGYKTAIIAMGLTAIAPWHIMLSRWGLESNLFPAMFILSVWALLKAFDRRYFLFLSAFLFALSLYSYGSAYLVVTLFCLICFGYILLKKLIPVKICLLSAAVFILAAFPIYLFVLVNLFHLGDISLGLLSVPQTYGSRMISQTGVSVKEFFQNSFNNAVLQTDFLDRNALPFYGCFYLISLPFCIMGIFSVWREKTPFGFVLKTALICSFALFLVYRYSNINRVNAIYLPLILFTSVGISAAIKDKRTAAAILASYLMLFAGFTAQYFGDSYRSQVSNEFFESFDQAIMKAGQLKRNGDTVYVTERVNMPYIYVLFYLKVPPAEYHDTVRIANRDTQFQKVTSFGDYVFDTDSLRGGQPGIYIVKNSEIENLQQYAEEIYEYEAYTVAVIK